MINLLQVFDLLGRQEPPDFFQGPLALDRILEMALCRRVRRIITQASVVQIHSLLRRYFAPPVTQPLDILCTPCCISHLAIAAESNLTQDPTRNDGMLPRFARRRIVMRDI